MTKDDIIQMAKEAGFEFNSVGGTFTSGYLEDYLERFANLVASAEREICAKVCEDKGYYSAVVYADAIRAMSQS